MAHKEVNLSRVVREILRNYLEFEEYSSQTGEYVVEYNGLFISFIDLQNSLSEVSKRKREAVFYNVILDWRQQDVADKMGITTVTVGQYVDQACQKIAKKFFPEQYEEENGNRR